MSGCARNWRIGRSAGSLTVALAPALANKARTAAVARAHPRTITCLHCTACANFVSSVPPFLRRGAFLCPTIPAMKTLLLATVLGASVLFAQSGTVGAGWTTNAGDAQGRRYSPLTQINTTNVAKLKLAWQYGVADASAGAVSAGRPKPGRPDSRARRALHLDGAADDRRARSGDRHRDLEARARQRRRAEPRRVVLARRRPASPREFLRARPTDVCSRSTPRRENWCHASAITARSTCAPASPTNSRGCRT